MGQLLEKHNSNSGLDKILAIRDSTLGCVVVVETNPQLCDCLQHVLLKLIYKHGSGRFLLLIKLWRLIGGILKESGQRRHERL